MAIYRLPFANELGWVLGTGNWDDPTWGHGAGQAYAYDFGHPEGGYVRAARAGTVIKLRSTQIENTWGNEALNAQGLGAGNYILIRHVDGSVAAYDHLQKDQVLVQENQWVAQGRNIARSGNTGNSSAPHLHFEVLSYWNSDSDRGPSILVHFDDQTHQFWRPRDTDTFLSNNFAFLQDSWRWCNRCQGFFFGGNLADSHCPHPQGGLHSQIGSGNYAILTSSTDANDQPGWRRCKKCQGLFLEISGSKCPFDHQAHDATGSMRYFVSLEAAANGGQTGWRRCKNCQGLFFSGNPGSFCPTTGSAHVAIPTDHFSLLVTALDDLQDDWTKCDKCHGLYFKGNPGSLCPKDNGQHSSPAASTNYILVMNSPDGPGEQTWRWCRNCQGLFSANGALTHCPNGQAHDGSISASYALVANLPKPGKQPDWKWCNRCQGLWAGENSGSVCPAPGGGEHSRAGSGNYAVPVGGAVDADHQSNWRWCNKCQGLFHLGTTSVCPADKQAHTPGPGTSSYVLSHKEGDDGQPGWRLCTKCSVLFMGENPNPHCPATGAHTPDPSLNFVLSTPFPGEDDWRRCGKCQGLFRDASGSVCPADHAEHSQVHGVNYKLLR